MFLQTLNIEWGQIDPKDKRRVNGTLKWGFRIRSRLSLTV